VDMVNTDHFTADMVDMVNTDHFTVDMVGISLFCAI
jgi:hypothetical protein